ncbi:hypothetical protein LguiA_016137 [Lonicera macranthoides]
MDLKPTTIITPFLLLLLAVPCFSRGGMYVQTVDSGIYDIDYRGPETHSYLPPPDLSGAKPINIHQERVMAHTRSKGFRAGNTGGASVRS